MHPERSEDSPCGLSHVSESEEENEDLPAEPAESADRDRDHSRAAHHDRHAHHGSCKKTDSRGHSMPAAHHGSRKEPANRGYSMPAAHHGSRKEPANRGYSMPAAHHGSWKEPANRGYSMPAAPHDSRNESAHLPAAPHDSRNESAHLPAAPHDSRNESANRDRNKPAPDRTMAAARRRESGRSRKPSREPSRERAPHPWRGSSRRENPGPSNMERSRSRAREPDFPEPLVGGHVKCSQCGKKFGHEKGQFALSQHFWSKHPDTEEAHERSMFFYPQKYKGWMDGISKQQMATKPKGQAKKPPKAPEPEAAVPQEADHPSEVERMHAVRSLLATTHMLMGKPYDPSK